MTYYYAGKPTGAHYEDGTPEIGNTCSHKHHTIEAASKCADKHEAPGFTEWGVYREPRRCKVGWVNAGHTLPDPHITS